MRILQLVQKPQARGVEIFTSQLADHLMKLGNEVMLVNIFSGTYDLPFTGGILTLDAQPKWRFFDLPAWKLLAETIENWQPDIVQANAGDTLKYAVFSKLIFRWTAPIVFRNASMPSLYLHNSVVKFFNRWLYRYVSGIASVSAASFKDFRKTFVTKDIFHQVLPIGIDPEKIGIPYPTHEKDNILVHIGGFTFEKDHNGLLQLFRKLLESRPKSQLWLFGDGPLKQDIEDRCRDLGIHDKVIFKGNILRPFSAVPTNAVLLLASKIEGLPAVILESFYAKIPVIAYGVGGIPEILQREETGWCVSSGRSNEFLVAIERVLSLHARERDRILSNAYQLVTSTYTIEKIALEFEKFYVELLSREQKN
jgi:glycosyltransferase involved in cell wall biosynthesis